MKNISVNLSGKSYPIYIGKHILTPDFLQKHIVSEQVCIITNETVALFYLSSLEEQLKRYQCNALILPDGEIFKTLETVGHIVNFLIERGHRRNTTLIALGGGVIGDMVGFAAACYQRGAHFIQVPTTLLSQVDASIGGKTGVNHPLSKNLIGAFYQPEAVFIDTNMLKTLPERQFNAGLAEIIKAALIADPDFFSWLEQHISHLNDRDEVSLQYAIEKACRIKVKIVETDEREANQRALLNLGHTFGHALERLLGYQEWLHGEAVAIGLVLAAQYSKNIGWLDKKSLSQIRNILTMAKLPIRLPHSITPAQLIECMHADKKMETSALTLVLLKAVGWPVLSKEIDLGILEASIARHIE